MLAGQRHVRRMSRLPRSFSATFGGRKSGSPLSLGPLPVECRGCRRRCGPAPSSAASRARSPARTRRVRPGTAPARHHLQAARAVQARTHHRPGGGGRRRRDMGENAVKQPAAVLRGHGRSAAARPRPARRADGGRRRTPRGSHDAAGPGENRSVKALRNGRDRRGGGLTATEQHVPIPLRTRLGACP
jgi:hypothetical protein